jgi:hypothetical protein
MKIPNKVKIGGLTYKIKMVDMVSLGPNYIGCCDYKASVIEIAKDMDAQKQEETLIHEMVHAMMEHAGYKEQDEEAVHRTATAFHMLIKDNPGMFKA